jgi:D-lactate dehydrogenase (cytochrome)
VYEITATPLEPVAFADVAHIRGYDAIRTDYPGYLSDESKLTMGPFDFLFFPKDEVELAAVIREMTGRGVGITVAGARTGVVGGCVPPGGAMVSLEKMNRMLALYYVAHADEWRVRAQPGVLISELDRAAMSGVFRELETDADKTIQAALVQFRAQPAKYFYPPDPTEMNASLGGNVATNASGARTFRYGPTRDWVRGLRVMTLHGEILDIPRGKYFSSPGGQFTVYHSTGDYLSIRVPDYTMPRTKNTAGFYASPHMDLVDLFIGSEGAYGIITAVDVGLLPWQPKCSIVQFVQSDDQALSLVKALRSEKRLQLDFIEFYSANALNLLKDLQADDPCRTGMPAIPESAGAAVFFELAFDPEAVMPDGSVLEEAVAKAGVSLADSWAGYESREAARFKMFRHLLPETVTRVIAERKKTHPGLHRLSSDLAVPDEHLADIWNLYKQRLNDAGIEWVGYGHVGNNHFHISSMPRDIEEMEKGMAIYKEFAERAVAYGGTISAEHGIGKLKVKYLKTMYSDGQLEQMRALKQAFDPGMLLNPGNIFTH